MAPARTDTEEFSPMAAWAPPSSVLVREVGDRLVAVGDAIASPIRPAAGARATPSTAGSAGALVLSASSRIPMRAWPVRAFALATGGVLLLVAVFLGARRITQQPTLERQSTANSALPSITLSVASAAPPASTDFSAASPAVAESGAPQLAPSASAASMPPVAPIPPVAAAAPPATMKPPPRYDDFKPSVSLTPASAPSHSARAAVAPSSARPSAPPKPKPRDDGLDLILDKP